MCRSLNVIDLCLFVPKQTSKLHENLRKKKKMGDYWIKLTKEEIIKWEYLNDSYR